MAFLVVCASSDQHPLPLTHPHTTAAALSSDGLEVEAGYTGPVWSWPPPDNFLADLVECYKVGMLSLCFVLFADVGDGCRRVSMEGSMI